MIRRLALLSLTLSACGFQLGGVLGSSIDESRDTESSGEPTTTPASTGGEAGSDGPGPAASSTGEAEPDDGTTASGSGGDGPAPPRGSEDCCTAHASTGCVDASIQACVCEVDPACCTEGWDELCVQEIDKLGCGTCIVDPKDMPSACCGETDAPGCGDAAIEACVCDVDAYCCLVSWDESCAAKAEELGCTTCDAGANASTDCCTPHPTPGCDDATVAECVCTSGDKFCCETGWDELCVQEVDDYGCGTCGGVGDGGTSGGLDPLSPTDCCTPGNMPTCPDAAVTECVCDYDAYCCEVAWDGVCVENVDVADCGTCMQFGSGSGSESSGSSGSTGA